VWFDFITGGGKVKEIADWQLAIANWILNQGANNIGNREVVPLSTARDHSEQYGSFSDRFQNNATFEIQVQAE
jgi:hypothetical protein